jgi:hypothetical protein
MSRVIQRRGLSVNGFEDLAMRLPRFHLRTLLVAIAAIAAVLGARSFQRVSRQYSAVAAMHREAHRQVAEQRDILAKGVSRREGETYNPDEAVKFARSAWEAELIRERVALRVKLADALRQRMYELTESTTYHAKMRDKYERAAAYPWLSVTTDPSKPE